MGKSDEVKEAAVEGGVAPCPFCKEYIAVVEDSYGVRVTYARCPHFVDVRKNGDTRKFASFQSNPRKRL